MAPLTQSRRGLAAAAAALAGLLVAAAPTAADIEDDPDTTVVQVLGINDFHGRILPDAFNGSAGAASLATAIAELEEEWPNSVFAAAGDLIGASTFESFIQDDKPTIDALNLAGLDVSAVGNHEFDQGYDDLVNRVMAPYDEDDNPYGGAEWEYLGANVRFVDTGDPALPETWITSFDGVDGPDGEPIDVGFVGAVTDSTPSLVTPSGVEGLEFEDEAVAANRSAAVLEEEGAELIVLLVHEGAPTTEYADAVDTSYDFGAMLAELDPSIDAVVSGHTHLAYDHRVPVPEWEAEDRAVTERPVVSAGQYGMALNRLLFEFDADGGLADLETSIVDLVEDGADAPVHSPDPVVEALVQQAVDEAEVLGSVVLGELEDPLYRARTAEGTPGSNRGGESTLGNAVADVQLWSTRELGTDIAFMNPGGLRADLLGAAAGDRAAYPSDVTYKQAADVQPFANTLETMTLTGAQIESVLEEQWQPEGEQRPFLRLGTSNGFVYTYDPTAATGERITSMWLDGEQIQADDEFTVVANSFLAAGGDNFSTFTEASDRADSGRVDLQGMVDYLAENGSLSADFAQRSVGAQGLPETFTVGTEVSFTLTSLAMTDPDGIVDDEVTLTLGGEELGSFPVTDALLAAPTDEQGQADVSFTVPDVPAGDAVIEVTGGQTGTVAWLPVTIAASDVEVAACELDYKVHGTWPNGFIAQVWLRNLGDEPIKDWNVSWTFAGDERITDLWGGSETQTGANVEIDSMSWNSTVRPGGEVTFGFVGASAAGPSGIEDVLVNGLACSAS